MKRMRWLAVGMILAAQLSFAQTAPPPVSETPPPATLALVTTFADGRISFALVSERPSKIWTTNYPRIDSIETSTPQIVGGITGPNPPRPLQITRVRVGDDVHVTVGMLRYPTINDEEVVATVIVRRGRPVVVDELRRFFAQPIQLSIIEAIPMVPFLPTVTSVAPEIEISHVDLLTAPYPGYRVTVRNLARQSVALFGIQSYRGTDKALSRLERGDRGRPAMAPGESHTFDLPVVGGSGDPSTPWSPVPLDMIEIDSVLWEDGSAVGGHGVPLNFGIAADGGQRLQLQRAIEVLRAAGSEAGGAEAILSAIRRGYEDIPEWDDTRLGAARQAMQSTRATVTTDLERFERSAPRDPDEVRRWIETTIRRYENWIKRLAA